MKIVCESCGAKYSIADDRVAGKVFKIRCKRCSEVIVVRGDQDAGGAAAGAAAPAEDQNAIWHVVVDGEQAGPYTVSQLAELMNGGRVDWEAYVWAEGFDNWLPMRDVPDLVNQLSGQQQAAAEPAYRAPSTGTLTGQPSMGADPFADADQDSGGMFGGGGGGGGHDLFAAAPEPASPFGGGGVVASSPSPRVAAESAMTGARNENSVLFSLKNLQALATGTPSMSPPTGGGFGGGGGGGAGGFAAGEGSGLIDIRALAAATGVSDARGAGGPRDELLTIGSQGGAFGSLGSPILAHSASDDDGNKKTMIWAIVAAVAMLSAAAVAIVFVLKPTTQQAVAIGPAPVAPAPVPAPAPAPAPTPTPDPGSQAAAPEEHTKADGPSGSSSGSSRRHRESSSGDSKPSASSGPSSGSGPAPINDTPKAPSKPSGPRSLDDLLNDAVSPGASSKPAASAAPKSDLAETPTRDQVKSSMGSVKDDVSACAKNGETGVATVSVSVAGESGRVTNAQVSGVTGPIGSCIAQAVRKAQFPKFSNKVFKVAFPFKL